MEDVSQTVIAVDSASGVYEAVSLEEADVYLETVLNTDAWDYSEDKVRLKALKQATRIIKGLNIAQPERNDMVTCVVEIALKLLEGVDPESELANAAIASVSFNGVKQDNNTRHETPLHVIAGVPSAYAFSILIKYMPNPTTVRLDRCD